MCLHNLLCAAFRIDCAECPLPMLSSSPVLSATAQLRTCYDDCVKKFGNVCAQSGMNVVLFDVLHLVS